MQREAEDLETRDGLAVVLRVALAGMEVAGASLHGPVRTVPALPVAGILGTEDCQNW